MNTTRAHWGSRLGFVLAAAGSAVGLGNIWKFPYITGQNGGGAFVLIYLVCVALVGLPIMTAEVLLGRMTQSSPVGAFRAASSPRSPFQWLGYLGVGAGFIILSYYSVVAGWTLHYAQLAARGQLTMTTPEASKSVFSAVVGSPTTSLLWHLLFMAATTLIVFGGVRRGLELGGRVFMPALFALLLALFAYALTLPGFGRAADFVFGFHAEHVGPRAVLEALGHSFFTLSVGMGAMLTYGSYLDEHADVVTSSLWICALDTLVALLACLVMFPIIFSRGMAPSAGPGLVFVSMPLAFAQLPFGAAVATAFFVLLAFAALTSTVSLLEVVVAHLIDQHRMARERAALLTGAAIALAGVPSAVSGSWLDACDYLATNWLLPIGGLGIALFMAFRVSESARRAALAEGAGLGSVKLVYLGWLQLLRYVVPVAIVLVMANALGVLKLLFGL